MKKNGQVFLSLPTSRSEGGEGREKPPTGTQRKNVYIYVYVKITEAQRKEGRKPQQKEGRKKITKEVYGRGKGREGRKKNGRKKRKRNRKTSIEKRIHICISKGKREKNVAKTEERLRKNVYVGSKFLPMQGRGRPCVQD